MGKIVATIKLAEGNAEAGRMWKETAVFEHDTPLCNVMQWARDRTNTSSIGVESWIYGKDANVSLSLAQEPFKKPDPKCSECKGKGSALYGTGYDQTYREERQPCRRCMAN